jgi:hypothetical protein
MSFAVSLESSWVFFSLDHVQSLLAFLETTIELDAFRDKAWNLEKFSPSVFQSIRTR